MTEDERASAPRALFERARGAVPRRGELAGARLQGGGRQRRCSWPAGNGAYVWDADGNRYLDFMGSWGPLILGHADPDVLEAIRAAAADGTTFGASTEREIALGEALQAAFPSLERMRLVSSGTEATMSALRLARGFTGRDEDHQGRGRLPRPRRHAAGGGRLGRGHPGHPRLGRRDRRGGGRHAAGRPGTTRRRCAPRCEANRGRGRRRHRRAGPRQHGPGAAAPRLPAGAARAVRRARRPADLRRGDHRLPRRAAAAPRRCTASGPTSPAWARSSAAGCRWACTAGGPTSWRRSPPTGRSTRRGRCRGTRWRWRPGWRPSAS